MRAGPKAVIRSLRSTICTGRLDSSIAEEARLLCFDEMVVNNMADAAIMSRLFTGLLNRRVTIVTTSNRPPDDLYKDGLNRQLFLPFIDLVKDRLDVMGLNGPTDYRRDRLGNAALWHVPNGPDATKALSTAFFRLTDYPVEDRAKVPGEERQPYVVRAKIVERRRGFLVQEAVRRGSGRQRLSRRRPSLSHGHHRRYSGNESGIA